MDPQLILLVALPCIIVIFLLGRYSRSGEVTEANHREAGRFKQYSEARDKIKEYRERIEEISSQFGIERRRLKSEAEDEISDCNARIDALSTEIGGAIFIL